MTKLTDLQLQTLRSIDEGKVQERRFGHGAWRIQGASPGVVGRLVQTFAMAEWMRGDADTRNCVVTQKGREALLQASPDEPEIEAGPRGP